MICIEQYYREWKCHRFSTQTKKGLNRDDPFSGYKHMEDKHLP